MPATLNYPPADRRVPPSLAPITIGRVTVDQLTRVALVDGDTVNLTHLEYRALLILAANTHRIVTRDALTRALWPYEVARTAKDRRVDQVIQRLRRKLPDGTINNSWGTGWRLVVPPDDYTNPNNETKEASDGTR